MFKEIVFPVSMWVLAVLVIASAMTGAYVADFANDCAAKGGTFANEGLTSWCRY